MVSDANRHRLGEVDRFQRGLMVHGMRLPFRARFRRLLMILALAAVATPLALYGQGSIRRVVLRIRNAPPEDSARAVALLSAAMERDTTVRVVSAEEAAPRKGREYVPVQFMAEVTYRKRAGGTQLDLRIVDVMTGEIVRRETVRLAAPDATQSIPPLLIPERSANSRAP